MLSTFLSLINNFNSPHDTYNKVSAIIKGGNDKTLQYLKQIAGRFERLSDKILYAKNLQGVQDITQSRQRYVGNLREVGDSLEWVQRVMGNEILSSALIWTPQKMQKAMQNNPWEVLLDIRPVNLATKPPYPDRVPILFQYRGVPFIGWQQRSALPIIFDCQYDDELWVPTQLERLSTSILQKKPGEIFRDHLQEGSLGPEMVVISAGRFRMGDIQGTGRGFEQPVHEVSVNSFAIGRYTVTFAEYDKFVEATGREKPDDETWGRGNRPVINVSWHDAVAYTKWLSHQTGQPYRLPTEAEWEYAARAGTETDYWWGHEIGTNQANAEGSGSQWSGQQTAPVGSFVSNPFGIYDTVGNIWEWCADNWHKNYKGAPSDGSAWESGGEVYTRVLRGGSWSFSPINCSAALRSKITSVVKDNDMGFRVAMDIFD
jgi:formylglycine-generating enzyme required for sulfatase activity